MAAGVPAALPVGDLVAKRLLKSAFWEPGCGEGWANCVLELVWVESAVRAQVLLLGLALPIGNRRNHRRHRLLQAVKALLQRSKVLYRLKVQPARHHQNQKDPPLAPSVSAAQVSSVRVACCLADLLSDVQEELARRRRRIHRIPRTCHRLFAGPQGKPPLSLPNPPYLLLLPPIPMPAPPSTPVYLFLVAFAFFLSARILSTSLSRSHLEKREMRAGVVDDTFGAVLDQKLHKLQSFVDLPPLFCRLLGKAFVDHWHDFVECLAVLWVSGWTTGAPWLVVGRFADFRLHLGVVHDSCAVSVCVIHVKKGKSNDLKPLTSLVRRTLLPLSHRIASARDG
ncbi:hypothetical protein KC338_g292 [Hortaea werneckii]|nr:hypothetical protein KC338_g292 [Hortaea werneckii]